MVIGFSLKTYYSIQHLQAAAYFSQTAVSLEKNLVDDLDHSSAILKGYVSTTLFTSVAFLEALANELFADAAQETGGHLSSLPKESLNLIAEIGETDSILKSAVLSKFAILLRAAGKNTLEKDRAPYRDAAILIRLRNELVHYKASFFDVGTEGMVRPGSFHKSNLPQQIDGKFKPRSRASAFAGDQWLGCGCSQWGVTTAVAYADAVFNALGIHPYYDHVRPAISSEKPASDA